MDEATEMIMLTKDSAMMTEVSDTASEVKFICYSQRFRCSDCEVAEDIWLYLWETFVDFGCEWEWSVWWS